MAFFIAYAFAGVMIILGLLSANAAFSKSSPEKIMKYIHYVPIKNIGRPFYISLSVVCLAVAILLLIQIRK